MHPQNSGQETIDPPAQVKGEIERITFRNEDNGFSILRVRDLQDSHSFAAVGTFVQIGVGERYIFSGAWVNHSQFGRQFKVQRVTEVKPTTKSAIARYLSSGLFNGIGEKTAQKIVNFFGNETLEILEKNPEQIKIIPKIGKRTALKVLKAWMDKKHCSEVMMFLHRHEIPPTLAQKIYKLYGPETIAVVTRNPYILLNEVRGVGFLTADKIARSIGIKDDDPQRIQQGILHVLSLAEDKGHCFLRLEQLKQKLNAELALDSQAVEEVVNAALEALKEKFLIFSEYNETGEELIYKKNLLIAENNVSMRLNQLLHFPLSSTVKVGEADAILLEAWVEQFCDSSAIKLSTQQKEAVLMAGKSKVFILTGGPGVGKTTTANTIIQLFKNLGRSVALAAPTGRAAQRLKETTSLPAKTIHRLLEWSAEEGAFKKNSSNALAFQVIIIDEASMIDLWLADSLLQAVPDSAQLIFIGDVDQLPSIGAGNVLRDLINSQQVPTVKLTEIFRQAATSHIVRHAHQINSGLAPEFSREPSSDCRFLTAETPEEITSIIKTMVTGPLVRAGYNAIRDIQILTPMNRGDLGSISLNLELQALLNPEKKESQDFKRGSYMLRPGDKVIQTVNNYELGVFNGDIGFIEHTHVEGGKLSVLYDSRRVMYEGDQVFELNLAYAITIHKSQGSEFPVVLIPVSMQHYIMLQRNLIYTALTRAKKIAIFIGVTRALELAIRTETSALRQTRLSEKIKALNI